MVNGGLLSCVDKMVLYTCAGARKDLKFLVRDVALKCKNREIFLVRAQKKSRSGFPGGGELTLN